jgi:hypothetical protein
MRTPLFLSVFLIGAATVPLHDSAPYEPASDAIRVGAIPAAAASAPAPPPPQDDHGFRFVRVKYDDVGGNRRGRWGRRGGGHWETDYPRAERHLHEAIERTTGLYVEGPPIVLELTDERIFEHPVLYLTEPGYWGTNEEEVEMLRTYLNRGGFLIIDDFHDYGRGYVGPQWNNMYDNIKRVFPDREPVELTADHPIWAVYYDIDPDAAITTKNGGRAGGGGFGPLDDIYYGIFDDNGRMMVAICYNQDIGDGWEWPENNLAEMSTISFQMAINIILYALTH